MINLDDMEPRELMLFWFKHQRGQSYRDLFPQGGKGSKRATWDLANYASNRATAVRCRLRGEIDSALMYEHICNGIYAQLPTFARFW